MKRIILAVSVLLMSSGALSAAEPQQLTKTGCCQFPCGMEPRQFCVTGYGKIPYTADLVDIRFSVSVRNNDAESSKKKHDRIIVKINEYLKEKEYPNGILSLRSSILQRQKSTNIKEDDFYITRSEYLLRTDRVQDANSLQMELVGTGADEIQSVSFLSSKQRQFEDEARKAALKDAMEKAGFTAETLGLKPGKAVNVLYEAPSRVSDNSIEVTVKVAFSIGSDAKIQGTVHVEPVNTETNPQKTVPADAVKTGQ